MKNIKLLAGSSNLPLARKIARYLSLKLGEIEIQKFSDGETYVNVKEKVKGKRVFVIQSGFDPANENLVELLLIIEAIKRLKAKEIISVLPFYPYRRQERKVEKGEPVSAQLVARLLETAGLDKALILHLHSPKIKNFFRIPVKEIFSEPVFVNYFKKKKLKNPVVVAPDQGALKLSKKLASALSFPYAYFYKSRQRMHDKVGLMKLKGGFLKNKEVIMFEDEINTGGTVVENIKELKKQKCLNIYIAATHGILAGPAVERLKKLPIKEVIFTDSINIPKEKRIKKIKILSCAKILAEAIKENAKDK